MLKTMKSLFWVVLLFLFACSEPVAPSNEPDATVSATLTLASDSTVENWLIENVEGDAVTSLGLDPTWTLTVGKRYSVINTTGVSHPFRLIDANTNLLLADSLNLGVGKFQNDANVNAVIEGNKLSFTLTQALAEELDAYLCAFHPSMLGNIDIATSTTE